MSRTLYAITRRCDEVYVLSEKNYVLNLNYKRICSVFLFYKVGLLR